MPADNDALARELRDKAQSVREDGEYPGEDELYDRAADALESRLAADREALTDAIYAVFDEEEFSAVGLAHTAERIADRLLATGVMLRVPTRDELGAVLRDHAPMTEYGGEPREPTDKEWQEQADAVLLLLQGGGTMRSQEGS